jgi:hypothetical protein
MRVATVKRKTKESDVMVKINLDGTLYGISQDKFIDELLNQTSSSVRGEELLQLINLIVQFLVGHVHPFHGLPPVPVATNRVPPHTILFPNVEKIVLPTPVQFIPLYEYAIDCVVDVPTATNNLPFHATPFASPGVVNGDVAAVQVMPSAEYANIAVSDVDPV